MPEALDALARIGRKRQQEEHERQREFDAGERQRRKEEEQRRQRDAAEQERQRRQREEQERQREAAARERRRWGQEEQQRERNPASSKMSASQAREILGVKAGATEQEIRAAYTRLMKRLHPDVGGSEYFSKQLNAARDVLLG